MNQENNHKQEDSDSKRPKFSNMKINVRLVKGGTKEVEADPDCSVLDLKKTIEETLGREYFAEGLKLIHAGKIMHNDKNIKDYDVKPESFLVAMPGKRRAQPVEEDSSSNSNTNATPAATPAAAAAAAPAASTTSSSTTTSAANSAPTMAADDSTVTQLVDMGFPRDQVEAALRAAFGNRDRAVEYLTNGIPDNAAAAAAASPGGGGGSAPATPAAAAAAPPAASGGGASGGPLPSLPATSPLAPLASNPHFMQMRSVVQQRPELLPAILQQLAQQQPELVETINQNQEDFYILLNTVSVGGGAGGGQGDLPPGAVRIQITQEENEAIERLCALGFNRDRVIEAYLACDKDENLAANYLFQDN